MFERFQKPLQILCLLVAAWLVWQMGSLLLRGDPLAKLKIPALPTLPPDTNGPAQLGKDQTNAPAPKNGTNLSSQPAPQGKAKPAQPKAPGPMAGGMPGGRGKTIPVPPEVQGRVDRIIDSELLGPVVHPMPLALIGISDDEAFIRATNGQIDSVKVGGEMGGIKLLRIGTNRVLVQDEGEMKELTMFDGLGGESLMPKATNAPMTNALTNAPSTNSLATNAPSTKGLSTNTPPANAPTQTPPARSATYSQTPTELALQTQQKEFP